MSKAEHPDISDGSDDEDYKPENDEACPGSEVDTDDGINSSDDNESTNKQPRKKRRRKDIEEKTDDKDDSATAEEEKKRSDALWADFLSDVDPPPKMEESPKISTASPAAEPQPRKSEKRPVEKIFNFAGEEVKVPIVSAQKSAKTPQSATLARPSRSSGGGLSSVLGSIGKKPKMGTLEKSKIDWDSFKTNEGISEELATFNKGKDGYLERQDFLERTDYRQFDLERNMRQKKRSTR